MLIKLLDLVAASLCIAALGEWDKSPAPTGYTFVSTGVASPQELWLDKYIPKGSGIEACYKFVLTHDQCAEDYFTYATRDDQNCGCKGAPGPLSVITAPGCDMYRIESGPSPPPTPPPRPPPAPPPTPPSRDLDLSNWMGQLEPVIGDSTILDLSMPGSHDTLTYDLSTSMAEGFEGLDPQVSKLLHTVTPLIAGRFMRKQGQTQGLDIVSQLNAGVRFIDFRIMYSDAPIIPKFHKDWYNLHACQSIHPALVYLKKVHKWLQAHPKEILVFWVSRHGKSSHPTGTAQYPNTTPEERQAWFKSVKSVFGNMMHDSTKGRVKDTSVSTLWKRGTQLLWYAEDFVESTASSPLALDAKLVENHLPGSGYGYGSVHEFRSGKSQREATKANDKFFLMSLAGSDECKYKPRALLTFLPLVHRKANIKTCAACYHIPHMTVCPMSLQDSGQINNYYNQIVLEGVFQEGQHNTAVDFPNAIYIDGLDVDGRIRTGTTRLNPGRYRWWHKLNPKTAGYGYSATVIAATVRRLCRESSATACTSLMAAAAAARAKHPVQTWDDAAHGRSASPPPLPSASDASIVV